MFEQITELIGKIAAAKLQAQFAGREIYIPAVRNDDVLAKRNRRINELYRRKMKPWTIKQLMHGYDLSRRQIWNILKAAN